MKKIFLVLFLLSSFLIKGQDIAPIPSINFLQLKSPNNPFFWYNKLDSAIWMFNGYPSTNGFGWTRLATNRQLIKYYVPYQGAIDSLITNWPVVSTKLIGDTTQINNVFVW